MDSNPLQQDTVLGTINHETPHQVSLQSCIRISPCLQQGCKSCNILINNILKQDVTRPLRQDNILGAINPETPYQKPQNMRNRDTLCPQQGCLLYRTPSTHVHNLGADLNNSNASSTPPTSDELPQPPPDHPILRLNNALKIAIRENNIHELKAFTKLYN